MKKIFPFLLLLLSSPLFALEELTLYFLPSPLGLEWKGPRSLLVSAARNSFEGTERFLGHVWVELSCGQKKELIGMAPKSFDYLSRLFLGGQGLGVLFHSFEGKLESGAELTGELQGHLAQGRVNFTRFHLNQGQCARLTQYLEEYRKFEVGRHYGLAQRPLFAEGAGCSAFGASFLEVAGILEEEFKEHWRREIAIPLELAGPPLRDEWVGLVSLYFAPDEWAPEHRPHRKLTFWDPELMHRWVSEKLKSLPGNLKAVTEGKAKGIMFDKSSWPVPEGPIWRQHTDPVYRKTN